MLLRISFKTSDDEWTVIASEGECIEEAKKCDVMALNGENSISVPIRINDIDAMHFVIYDKNNIKLWSDNEEICILYMMLQVLFRVLPR